MGSEKRTNIILAIILLCCFAVFVYWGCQKEGYHVDEMYMYGTANSEYLPFMHMGEQEYSVKDWMKEYGAGENIIDLSRNLSKDISILKANGWDIKGSEIYAAYSKARECSNDMYTTTWMSGQAYKDYIAVSDTNRFNYISVLYNFRGDNHPPLYALLLHTVCSFHPGKYSKWYGLGLNIIIGIFSILLLYRTVGRFLGGKRTALMAAALYGLSAAAAITASYIRMYSLVTLMVTGVAYAHHSLASKNWEWDKKDRHKLVFFTLCAYLSQYYSVIYIFGIALASVVIMLTRKKTKSALRYILTMGITGVAGIVMWPFSLKAVFAGSRGAESIGGFFSLEGAMDRLGTMFYVLVRNCMGIPEWVYLALAAAMTVLIAVLMIKDKQDRDRSRIERAIMVTLPFVIYFVCISKMAPYLVDRYIMCIMPWCGTLLLCGLMFAVKRLKLKEKTGYVLMAVCYIPLLVFSDSFLVGNCEIYPGGQERDIIAGDTDCVYLLPAGWWNESAEDTLLLSKCRDTAVVREDDIDVLAGTYKADAGSSLLMVVHKEVEAGENIERFAASLTDPALGTELVEMGRESVRGNTWIRYEVTQVLREDEAGVQEAGASVAENPEPADMPLVPPGPADTAAENEAPTGLISSSEEIGLTNTDDAGSNYSFSYDGMDFTAVYTEDDWKIFDSYRVSDTGDMVIICEALIAEHPVHGADMVSFRTAEDMAYEWLQHNAAYAVLPEASEWRSHAKDVNLDPFDQGKSFLEIYEDRTGKKFDPADIL